MRTSAANPLIIDAPLMAPELLALTERRLDELERLKDLAYDRLGMIARATAALSPDDRLRTMLSPSGASVEFDRLMRSIRQVMVLEFELRGLFKAPDRDAPRKLRLVKSDRPGFVAPSSVAPVKLPELEDLLDIRTDYRRGPMDEIVGDIRKVVRTEAPLDDPFAPSAEKTVEPTPAKAPPKGPEYYMRARPANPESKPAPDYVEHAQNEPAMKAAVLAIRNLDNKGFRQPSKAEIRKRQLSRGPPK
jgi:hypothetical protein